MGVVLVWAATRTVLLLFVFQVIRFPGQVVVHDVEAVYQRWYPVLRGGAFPQADVTWQYPPGAAAVLVAPAVLPFLGYAAAFYWLALLADAAVFGALLWDARGPGRSPAGVWVWVAGVALAGPIVFARYDVMVTAVAVVALLLLARRPRAAGVLAGVGALLKVWPVLLLVGAVRGPCGRRAWLSAAGTVAVLAGMFAVTMRGAFAFLTFQRDRGTEVESLGAMVFHLGRHAGWPGRATMHYGSVEFLGPHVHLVSAAALGLSVLAFCWLLLWRRRAVVFTAATPYDAAFTALLLFTTTSRVISPQYMVWLIGVGAVCVSVRGGVQRLPVLLSLAATLLTTLEFPVFFPHVVASDAWGILLLGARNALLVTASVLAAHRLWTTSTVPAPAAPAATLRGAVGVAGSTSRLPGAVGVAAPTPTPAPAATAATGTARPGGAELRATSTVSRPPGH